MYNNRNCSARVPVSRGRGWFFGVSSERFRRFSQRTRAHQHCNCLSVSEFCNAGEESVGKTEILCGNNLIDFKKFFWPANKYSHQNIFLFFQTENNL